MRISARANNGGTMQVNPQMNGPGGETKIQLPPGTYTLTARRNNPENPEQAETTVTVPDHDIAGVVLQFAPIPSIPVELIVDSSVTSDNNNQPPTLPQLGLVLQSDDPDPERGDPSVRPTTRRDQSYVFSAPPGSYRLQSRSAGGWYIKSASYGDADLLRQELVVVPGACGHAHSAGGEQPDRKSAGRGKPERQSRRLLGVSDSDRRECTACPLAPQ